jgi:hypothetical protein
MVFARCTAARRRIARAPSSSPRVRTARRIVYTALPAPERPLPPPPCACPRRCALAAALAQQPRDSARANPVHARAPTETRPTTPTCLPHLRPQSACRRPPPTLLSARPSPPATGLFNLNDLYRYSAADNAWTALSPSGSVPSLRADMGFAATPDGMLYVFGGWSGRPDGNEGKWGAGGISAGVDGACCVEHRHAAARAALLLSLSLSCRWDESGAGGDK